MAELTEQEQNRFLQQERSKMKRVRESGEEAPEQFQTERWRDKSAFPIGTVAPESDESEG